jgi:Raf kinase inhibitor-like YbhB/YbcL family protein
MTGMGPFILSSEDFADGGTLDKRHFANDWGQCSGDNLNPHLSWDGAPEGTASFAITMRDLSAGNWSHWLVANIPADVTSVDTGGSDALPGVAGRNAASTIGYFGPCPPSPGHRYEFTIWALDSVIDLPGVPTYPDFFHASQDHVLGQASLIGIG